MSKRPTGREAEPSASTGAVAVGGSVTSDPARRQVLRRVTAALMIGGAAGLGTFRFYRRGEPVRSRRTANRTIADHRVEVPGSTPKMVIARGRDPGRNVEAAFVRLGGAGLFVGKHDVVVIKPNVGWDRRPEQAANTDPQVIAALVRLCRNAGATRIIVTDNPVNDAERCFVRSGILEAAQRAGAEVVLPERTRFHMVQIPGKLGRWPVAEPFIIATKIINVPVVKHHSLTRATLGMKNWYGVLGGRRNQLHQRIDDSVAELAYLMRPTLTVVDATRILMRNGPTGGSLADVREGLALAVSSDPIAADAWAAAQLDLDPTSLAWLRLGQEKKLGTMDYSSLNPLEITSG